MILRITGSKEIGQWFDGSVFLPFFNFSFGTFRALGKTPREIDRLQREESGFARMSAASFKNLPKSSPAPAALELLISWMIFKTCFSVVPTRQKSTVISRLE